MLLKYNSKDERHRGEYKNSNSVQAFDADGNSLGIVFETIATAKAIETAIEIAARNAKSAYAD